MWRPAIGWRPARPSGGALVAATLLVVGFVLLAPGSENFVGPRDPGVYVATGLAIARSGGTVIHDPALQLLAATVDPSQMNSWTYEHAANHARIRFPAQLFIRDLNAGTVEGGFLPIVPLWIALAVELGGLEPALHVAGAFGILALVYAMLASQAAATRGDSRATPFWPLVGAILAVSFPQVWWAREPMAESALGAFSWMVGWAGVHWLNGGGSRWAALAALGAICALLTRADGILVAGAVALLGAVHAAPGRSAMLMMLAPGVVAAGLHYAVVAPIYMSMTYGAATLSRAAAGLAAIAAVGGAMAAVWGLHRARSTRRLAAMLTHRAAWAQRAAVLLFIALSTAVALSGAMPGAARDAPLGGASPLAWLPGYVPWPILVLAAVGLAALGWNGTPRRILPLLLVGGLPALLYLPDALVTADHPWMTRRLVPAVIPLLAVAASVGGRALWQLDPPGPFARARLAGPCAAALLAGLGLGLAVAQDRELLGPRHGAGAFEGLAALAADLPPNAVVVFPAGEAGVHLAMPLQAVFGVDAFAIPEAELTPAIGTTLARMEQFGRAVYWAEDAGRPPAPPEGLTATRVGTTRISYASADHGRTPPPLQLAAIDHVVTLYRVAASP